MATVVSRARRRALPRRRGSPLRAAVIALLAVALGLELQRLPGLSVGLWLLAAPALVVLGFVVVQGPRWCLAGLLVLVILGSFELGLAVGPWTLRAIDVPYTALVAWVVVVRVREGKQHGRQIGQLQLGLFVAALGVSMLPLAAHLPGALTPSLVAWLRVVQAFSLVWLVPYALRNVKDLEFMLGCVNLALSVEVGRAVVQALLAGTLGEVRLSGAHSANTMGLLAALLILAALHSPVPQRGLLRGTMLVVGVMGLLATRSFGSIVAVAVPLAIFGFGGIVDRVGRKRVLLMPARFLLIGVVALAAIGAVKGGNLPQSESFEGSTTVHRTVLATAGLELFAEHPLMGVGFARAPVEVVSSRELNDKLRQRFGKNANPEFYPESGPPIQVHNAYVQVLAEAGLFGFGFLVAAALGVARGVRSVLGSSRAQPRVYACARCALVMLVAILVWWNDNGLYGGQPESVLAAAFIGLLAAVPRSDRPAASSLRTGRLASE